MRYSCCQSKIQKNRDLLIEIRHGVSQSVKQARECSANRRACAKRDKIGKATCLPVERPKPNAPRWRHLDAFLHLSSGAGCFRKLLRGFW